MIQHVRWVPMLCEVKVYLPGVLGRKNWRSMLVTIAKFLLNQVFASYVWPISQADSRITRLLARSGGRVCFSTRAKIANAPASMATDSHITVKCRLMLFQTSPYIAIRN